MERPKTETRSAESDLPYWLELAAAAAAKAAACRLEFMDGNLSAAPAVAARRAALGAFLVVAGAGAAQALPPPISIPVSEDGSAPKQSGGLFGFMDGLKRSSSMLGDLWGARTFLSRYGMVLAVQETSEYLGNPTGGTQRGYQYDGLTQAVLQLNTQRAFGWYGGTFNVSGLHIHGSNLSADNLSTLQTASGIEADRAIRLWELWYDQKFLDESRLDFKIGQQSLDQEFIVSSNALLFVNTMFGWPMLPSADMPGGGPAYPLSALGARAQWRPVNSLNFLVGAFNGSPSPHSSGDPQIQDGSGTSFRLNKGGLYIAEAQYTYPALGDMVYDGAQALSGTYRLGAWYDTERFNDPRYDHNGLSLADPNSDGIARVHTGDYSVYAVADQMVMRSDRDPNRTLSVFARAMGTPLGDRNTIDFSLNTGLVLHDPLPYRTDDSLGIGLGYAHVSSQVAGFQSDTGRFNPGTFNPQQHGETFIEGTYQRQIYPWLQLQPDVQYVFNPGGGVVNPNIPTERVKNEWVLGVRAIIQL
jgi:porin